MTASTERIAMGYIKGVFGIKGWLKVKTSTEYIDGLLDYREWFLCKDQDTVRVEVESGKVVGDELQVKFTHIHNREEAALLRGYIVEIPREWFAQAEDNEYYWADLVGMTVVNRQNAILGTVRNLMETGAHDVLMIQGEYGQKLIPFVAHYVDDVNAQTQTITVDWGIDY